MSCCGRRALLTHPAPGSAHCNGGNRAVCVEQVRRQHVDRRRLFIFAEPRHRLHASGGNYRRRRCRQRKLRRMQHVASFCSLSHHGATCARRWTWNYRVHMQTPCSRRCTWHQSSSVPLWAICAQSKAQGSVGIVGGSRRGLYMYSSRGCGAAIYAERHVVAGRSFRLRGHPVLVQQLGLLP